MDFYRIEETETKTGALELRPRFVVGKSKDLMIRGRSFYAIWDEEAGLWSTDEYDVPRFIDADISAKAEELSAKGISVRPKYISDFSSRLWLDFRSFVLSVSDSYRQLDNRLTFSNTKVRREDYVSKRLPYPLADGECPAYEELISTLYDEEEREKLEWAIGSIVSGDSRTIQKFLVLYGPAGTGKSTFLNLLERLFVGYFTTFEAKALTGSNNTFSMEVFRSNPLVAIQHDGDLSRIEDNSKLNSLVSHEAMTMNEKYKAGYTQRINAFLFMGTNRPVKISDAKSGLIRRLIDVHSSGRKVPTARYNTLVSQLDFELGAIASHCLRVYQALGRDYYADYRPLDMMYQTDVFFNFIESYFDLFKEQNGVTLKHAWSLYKEFCDEALIPHRLPMYRFREELKNYFGSFEERATVDDIRVRNWYSNFLTNPFKVQTDPEKHVYSLVLNEETSLLDDIFKDQPAQYASEDGKPAARWANVSTTLKDIDTSKTHYVKVPQNHIVIDFDLKGADGERSKERNLEVASGWPTTYAEFSKSGGGIHLHYTYDGDVSTLARSVEEGIELKVFAGDASLRRRLSKCNGLPVATISSGLPLKEKKMLSAETVQSERGLRDLIQRNLRKEIHPGTKPSVDFIHKILEDAYSSGMTYDVTDLRSTIVAFASNSTNQALTCLKTVQSMKFASEDKIAEATNRATDERLAIFDVEVFPNLFVVCWKYQGSDQVVKMINPTPAEIENLVALKLVGFNCRKYDNHILYARLLGYNNENLFRLSQRLIVDRVKEAYFGNAYDLSFADIYDFSSKKQGLKKFEIELGIPHKEIPLPWDQPVPDDKIDMVVEYCANDVNAAEAVLEDREQDFVARQILADLSGLPINATTQQHTAKIIFGGDRYYKKQFVYTDLSERFPGYIFEAGKSTYRGEITGEGGYVYSEPGIYTNVALLDVESMHPTSIEELNLFGDYTEKFSDLKRARMAIKHRRFDDARTMLDGRLAPYLVDETGADDLSYALKIVINSVYGLTSTKYDSAFRDPRNKDNIVAKRGALFMVDLKHYVQERGFTVAHIKTDSIKIPNATPEIIDLVIQFGKEYGYTFVHEATYDKFFLANDAVYVAKKPSGEWIAVGAQFQHPYVFKALFSHQPIVFDDMCETKTVTTAMYLDFEHKRPMYTSEGPYFIGRAGRFVPVREEAGGGVLLREKEGKYYSVGGTKGYFWLEADMVLGEGLEDHIDLSYFDRLVQEAIDSIKKFGDVEWFLR